jgi:hypothetical protein
MIKPEHRPWFPVKWEENLHAVYALQALQKGEANKDQQQIALDFFINKMCATYDMTYIPDSERDSNFAEGKRWVGNQLIKLLKLTGQQIQDVLDKQKSVGKSRKLGS